MRLFVKLLWTLSGSSTTSLKCIGNESAPIQLALCQFYGLAISNAKILKYFSDKIYRFYQTALGNCYCFKLPKCWLQFKKKIYRVIYYNFRHTFVPYTATTGSRRWLGLTFWPTDRPDLLRIPNFVGLQQYKHQNAGNITNYGTDK